MRRPATNADDTEQGPQDAQGDLAPRAELFEGDAPADLGPDGVDDCDRKQVDQGHAGRQPRPSSGPDVGDRWRQQRKPDDDARECGG